MSKPIRRRFKKRYFILILTGAYLLFANSCMTMRTSAKNTKAFFKENQVDFVEKTINLQERDIHYIETGKKDGHNLVFLHGSPGSWDAYKDYVIDPKLLSTYRIIAPDRPGFGKSGFRESCSLKEQSNVLNQLVKSLDNGKPITLVGHSYGGPLIVQMALDAPTLYQNLVILAGALDPAAEKPEKWRKPLTWVPLKYLVPGALKPSNDELWMLKEDLKKLQPRLDSLRQRTLIIHGKKDRLVPYENVGFMEESMINTEELEVISLENEDHFIVWTQEQLIKQSILDWTEK